MAQTGGRLSHADLLPSHVILSSKDHLTELVFKYDHVFLGHCGPTLLLSHAGTRLHVLGAEALPDLSAAIVSPAGRQLPELKLKEWDSCQHQGSLPRPFTLKPGHTRKHVLVKAYIALFVCFVTKAVRIEIVSDLTTEAFLAALKRFDTRRGLPTEIHTDNGTNFVGAKNDLAELYRFLSTDTTTTAINSYLLNLRITWHCIPEHAPHFGGLWEVAVKSTKFHLRRVVGSQRLDYEEFSTIAMQVESCLNSRPISTTTSHSTDGIMVLTPGHFLIGHELRAYPETTIQSEPSLHKRWTLCQAILHHFWRRWSGKYLQHLQKAGKWKTTRPNLQIGDVVIITDDSAFTNHWVMGKVVKVFTGQDNLVRAVDVQTETIVKRPSSSKDNLSLAIHMQTKTSILRRPIAKLALILPAATPASTSQPSTETNLEQ